MLTHLTHLFVKSTRGRVKLAEDLKEQTLALPDLKFYLGEKPWKELAWNVGDLAISTARSQMKRAYMNICIT